MGSDRTYRSGWPPEPPGMSTASPLAWSRTVAEPREQGELETGPGELAV